jgi:hypothetical protein
MSDIDENIIQEVEGVIALERNLEGLELQLSKDERFQAFLIKQKEAQQTIRDTWKTIEEQMIEHNIKSVKGEWGSITIAERTNYKADLDELPAKFIKKVADTTKIANFAKLEGELPKGVTTSTTKYLMKRIK